MPEVTVRDATWRLASSSLAVRRYAGAVLTLVAATASWLVISSGLSVPMAAALSLALALAMLAVVLSEPGRQARVAAARGRELAALWGLLEDVDECIYTVDRGSRLTYANACAARALGREGEEILGRGIWELVPAETRRVLEPQLARVLHDGRTVAFDASSPLAGDVRTFPFDRGVAVLVRNGSGARAGARDDDRLQAILQSATDAIITIDDEERITLFSAGAEQIFGCAAPAALGQPIDRFIPARFRAGHHPHVRRFGDTEGTREMDGELVLTAVRANGEEFPVEARISQTTVGRETVHTVILRDATERQRIEGEREELLARARAAVALAEGANRAKDDFLAIVAHELRTPLTPLLAWATLLRTRSFDEPTQRKALEVIERTARSQARLVEDLMDVSRIIAGKIRLEMRRMDLAPAVAAAVESLRPAADAKEIAVTTSFDPKAGYVSGDAGRLQQVVWNLLSNAIKFTANGGRVDLALRRDGPHVELVVSDTGRGMDGSLVPHVFERFRQLEGSTTRTHGGLGLGLAIVRHIVELHGATVSCDSPGVGKGSAFTVRLRVASPHATLREVPRSRQDHVDRSTRAAATDRRLAGLRVLVVDDDPDTLEILRTILTTADVEVRIAASAADAFPLVKTWRPDLLVSDIGMPDEDGYALIRRVRALSPGEGGTVPALALTAYARFEDRRNVLAAGFQMHAAKPIEPDELISLVANATALRESALRAQR